MTFPAYDCVVLVIKCFIHIGALHIHMGVVYPRLESNAHIIGQRVNLLMVGIDVSSVNCYNFVN